MALTDSEIHKAFSSGSWKAYKNGQQVKPTNLKVNPNSINVSLQPRILQIYARNQNVIDLHDPDSFGQEEIDCTEGFVLLPGSLYLAAVAERFECSLPLQITNCPREISRKTYFYPVIDGRSTTGRSGLYTHITAGRGDWGFNGHFTLELVAMLPIRVRAGDEIAQVYFEPLEGIPRNRYKGAYLNQEGPTPAKLGKERFQR